MFVKIWIRISQLCLKQSHSYICFLRKRILSIFIAVYKTLDPQGFGLHRHWFVHFHKIFHRSLCTNVYLIDPEIFSYASLSFHYMMMTHHWFLNLIFHNTGYVKPWTPSSAGPEPLDSVTFVSTNLILHTKMMLHIKLCNPCSINIVDSWEYARWMPEER